MKVNDIINESKMPQVYTDLEGIGFNDITTAGPGYVPDNIYNYEAKFKGSADPKSVHQVLIDNGWEMITHTVRGAPLDPYLVYDRPQFNSGKVTLHHKDGKVWYIVFDYRVSHD